MDLVAPRLNVATTRAAAGLALLAAIALQCAAVAQGEPTSDRERQLFAQLEQQRRRGDENSPALIQPLTDLGLLREEQGQLDAAAEMLDNARNVLRYNYGFSTLEEALLLGDLVRVEEARGNTEAAWKLEQEQLVLAGEHPQDLRTVPILRAAAAKRMDMLNRYRAGHLPPQIVLGCYYARLSSIYSLLVRDADPDTGVPMLMGCNHGSRAIVVTSLLLEARAYDAQAIEVLLQSGGYTGDDLPAILTDLLRKSDELQRGLPQYRDGFVDEFFDRVLGYESRNEAYARRRAELLVQVADFKLLRAHQTGRSAALPRVIEQYQQAFAQMGREGVEPAAIERIFAPRVPVALPTFRVEPLIAADEAGGSGRHVDIGFAVDANGRSERVRVFGATPGVTRAETRELARAIEQGSFRPRFVAGQAAALSTVVVRYYLDDGPS